MLRICCKWLLSKTICELVHCRFICSILLRIWTSSVEAVDNLPCVICVNGGYCVGTWPDISSSSSSWCEREASEEWFCSCDCELADEPPTTEFEKVTTWERCCFFGGGCGGGNIDWLGLLADRLPFLENYNATGNMLYIYICVKKHIVQHAYSLLFLHWA